MSVVDDVDVVVVNIIVNVHILVLVDVNVVVNVDTVVNDLRDHLVGPDMKKDEIHPRTPFEGISYFHK